MRKGATARRDEKAYRLHESVIAEYKITRDRSGKSIEVQRVEVACITCDRSKSNWHNIEADWNQGRLSALYLCKPCAGTLHFIW